jgi:hypothetical protein
VESSAQAIKLATANVRTAIEDFAMRSA